MQLTLWVEDASGWRPWRPRRWVVPLDLWNRVPDMTYEFVAPPVYSVVFERVPGSGFLGIPAPVGCFPRGITTTCTSKTKHGRPILNGYFSGPSEQRALALSRLDNPSTAGWLATLGVRYVLVVHPHVIPALPDPGAVDKKGFRSVTADYYATLFRVTAKPVPFVYSRSGLEPPEGRRNPHRWASSPTIDLEVIASCKTCRGRLRFTAVSLRQPRLLSVIDQDGNSQPVTVIKPSRTEVEIPLRFQRRTMLKLATTPGPVPISVMDPRTVSVMFSNLRFEPDDVSLQPAG